MPIFQPQLAGLVSGRTGTRPLPVLGMNLMSIAIAWMALVLTPRVDYLTLVPAFIVAGAGMGLFFAPIANVVLSAVRPEEEGKASGANNAIRELGGVFGVAVLAPVFATYGSYATGPSSTGSSPGRSAR
jgi:MFS family permease